MSRFCDVNHCEEPAAARVAEEELCEMHLKSKYPSVYDGLFGDDEDFVEQETPVEGGQNNGGKNSFYKLPEWVNDADTLSEYLELDGYQFNILKSLWTHKGQRHVGTDEEREARKCLHYAQRGVDRINRLKDKS